MSSISENPNDIRWMIFQLQIENDSDEYDYYDRDSRTPELIYDIDESLAPLTMDYEYYNFHKENYDAHNRCCVRKLWCIKVGFARSQFQVKLPCYFLKMQDLS